MPPFRLLMVEVSSLKGTLPKMLSFWSKMQAPRVPKILSIVSLKVLFSSGVSLEESLRTGGMAAGRGGNLGREDNGSSIFRSSILLGGKEEGECCRCSRPLKDKRLLLSLFSSFKAPWSSTPNSSLACSAVILPRKAL